MTQSTDSPDSAMTSKASPTSRVFRQVVTIEVLWLVGEGIEPPYTDMGAVVRDALTGVDLEGPCHVVPGEGSVSDVEELTA